SIAYPAPPVEQASACPWWSEPRRLNWHSARARSGLTPVDPPFHFLSLDRIGRLPTIHHPLDCYYAQRRISLAVLREEKIVTSLESRPMKFGATGARAVRSMHLFLPPEART